MEKIELTKNQIYIFGGVSGFILVVFISMVSFSFTKIGELESELSSMTENRNRLQKNLQLTEHKLEQTEKDLNAKTRYIEVLKSTISEIQQDRAKHKR